MNSPERTQTPTGAWWRFGHVWLVIAGPAAVVVAGFFTFYLAVRNPDPVVSTPAQTGQAPAGDKEGISQAPAVQARNHAATGVMPAPAKTKP
ncbi:MAG: nitrogen fixation protein FixH [Betaproteobacteria bacterium]|nr:nitrogen fixation protein FixH [Betaproteobacteria bacterium]